MAEEEFLIYMGYIFELIGTIAAIIMTYFVLKPNPKYIGNRLMATSTAGIAGYIGSILLYDLIATEISIQILYRIAIIFIMIGALAMYLTMQVMVHSSSWLKPWKIILPISAIIGFGIYISITDFITILNLVLVDTIIDFVPLVIVSSWVIIFVVATIIDFYLHGIKHASGQTKKNMLIFLVGLLVNLLALSLTLASNLVNDPLVGAYLDAFFFLTLAIGTGIMSIGFVRKSTAKNLN